MTCVSSLTHLLLRCLVMINEGIIVLKPFFLANLFIYLDDNQYIQNLIRLLQQILFTFVLVVVILGSITYGSVQRKELQVRDTGEANPINDPIIEIREEPSKKYPPDEKDSARTSRQLICYCDGSYSNKTRIGYSAFRASNGYNKCCRCPLRYPYSGSTESEVFAACLALQYTAKYQYDTLILYTDNLKVEQLATRPKKKDYDEYFDFFEALHQCSEWNDHFRIQVTHVRGHTTWYEQQKCAVNREFAKVDRQVRQKRQQYERRYTFPTKISDYWYMTYPSRCAGRYIRWIDPEKFNATLIITSDA